MRNLLTISCAILAVVVLIGTIAEGSPHDKSKQPPGPDRIVRYCEAMYQQNDGARAAKRLFGAMSKTELGEMLVPVRKRYYRGTLPYTSVAYVLAYYGVDVENNVERMLCAWVPPDTTPDKILNDERNGLGPAGDGMSDALDRIYRRHPLDSVVARTLAVDPDASAGEDHAYLIAGWFLRHPAQVLRVAAGLHSGGSKPDGVGRLGWILYWAGGEGSDSNDYSKVRSTLRALAKSDDKALAQEAVRLRRAFEKEVRLKS